MKKITITALLGGMFLLLASGCYRVATVEIDNSPAVTKTVSFGTDCIPILNKSCALTGCHGAGGHVPDLTMANAYNSLISGNYIDKTKPSNSTIYLWLTGKKAVIMPMGAGNNPSNINALVLAWITQGAKNN